MLPERPEYTQWGEGITLREGIVPRLPGKTGTHTW